MAAQTIVRLELTEEARQKLEAKIAELGKEEFLRQLSEPLGYDVFNIEHVDSQQQDEPEKLTCKSCGYTAELSGFDTMGSCPGCVFCNGCCKEINADTGEVSPLCGKCDDCLSLKDEGVFDAVQKDRGF